MTRRAATGQSPRQSTPAGLTVRVLRSRSDVDQLVPAWRELASNSHQSAFGFPSWALACYDESKEFDRSRLRVVSVWSSHQLVAVGPFAEERRGGLRILRFLGIWRAHPNRVVVSPDHDHAEALVWDAVRTPGTIVRLDGIAALTGPASLAAQTGWATRTAARSTCLTIDTSKPLDTFLQSNKRRLRQTLRTARRRVEEDGATIEHCIVDNLSDLTDLVAHIRSIELKTTDPFRQEGLLGVLAAGHVPRVLERAAREGRLQAQVLFADGQPFVYSVSLVGSGVLTGLVTGYDPAYRHLSPGHLCLAELYRWAHSQRLMIDLSLGDFEYKHRWSQSGYEVVNGVAAPNELTLALATKMGLLRDYIHTAAWRLEQVLRYAGARRATLLPASNIVRHSKDTS